MNLTPVQVYLFFFIILVLGFVFGYSVSRTKYRDRYCQELRELKQQIDKKIAENEKMKAEQSRIIAHAITKEWNRGFDAAFERLKNDYRFIRQWEIEHGITPGEMETMVINFEKETDNKEETK